jgi:hypothetical protein
MNLHPFKTKSFDEQKGSIRRDEDLLTLRSGDYREYVFKETPND